MSATIDLLPAPVVQATTELDHYVCCRSYETALCGTPQDTAELMLDAQESGNPMCVVCVDLDRVKYCPRGMTCPSVEGTKEAPEP